MIGRWPTSVAGSARPFSGGVAWDEPSRRYRMWYGCGDATFDDSNLALCLATSADGRAWDKENQTVRAGTNIVVATPLRSNNVFAHPQATDPSRRFVLGDSKIVILSRFARCPSR